MIGKITRTTRLDFMHGKINLIKMNACFPSQTIKIGTIKLQKIQRPTMNDDAYRVGSPINVNVSLMKNGNISISEDDYYMHDTVKCSFEFFWQYV